jgi:hypothetical protein
MCPNKGILLQDAQDVDMILMLKMKKTMSVLIAHCLLIGTFFHSKNLMGKKRMWI